MGIRGNKKAQLLMIAFFAFFGLIAQTPVIPGIPSTAGTVTSGGPFVLDYPTMAEATNDSTNTTVGRTALINSLEYTVVESVAEDTVETFQIGKTNKYFQLSDKTQVAKSVGLVNDALEIRFDISGSTLTAYTAVFDSSSVGKKVACVDCNSKLVTIDTLADYQGNVSVYANLPGSPNDGDIYKVTDNSDAPGESATSGLLYWLYATGTLNGDRWQQVNPYDNDVWEITAYISPTQVTVNYSAPAVLTNIDGVTGTNNTVLFDRLMSYAVTKQTTTINLDGQYLFTYDLETSYTKTSTLENCSIEFVGTGKRNTKLFFKHVTDDFADGSLSTPIPPGVSKGFIDFNQITQPTTSVFSIGIRGMTLEGHKKRPFRVDGKRRGPCLQIIGNQNIGDVTLENVVFANANSLTYFSDGTITATNCEWNGNYEAESGLQQFGTAEFDGDKCRFYNIGQSVQRNELDLKDPNGRWFYTHPNRPFSLRNSFVYNINGLGQFFSGGGLDEPSALPAQHYFENVIFHQGTRDYVQNTGIYSSRVLDLILNTVKFVGGTQPNSSLWAVFGTSNITMTNCEFIRSWVFLNLPNVGTNNVFYGDYNQVIFDNCQIHDTRIDFYGHRANFPKIIYTLKDCIHTADTVFNDVHRFLQGSRTGEPTTVNFIRNTFTGNFGSFNSSGWFFTESGKEIYANFIDCHFDNEHTEPGVTTISREFRDTTYMYFENCTSPDQIYIDNNTLINGALRGKNNNFEGGLNVTTITSTSQLFEFNTNLVYPDTLTAGTNTLITDWNEGEFIITGATPIQNFLFSVGDPERVVFTGDVIVTATGGNVDFVTGGNVAEAFTITDGKSVVMTYNPKVPEFYLKYQVP